MKKYEIYLPLKYNDGKDVEPDKIKQVREELIAKLMGSMLAPAKNWVSVLAQIPRQLVNVLAAVRDQKEKQG